MRKQRTYKGSQPLDLPPDIKALYSEMKKLYRSGDKDLITQAHYEAQAYAMNLSRSRDKYSFLRDKHTNLGRGRKGVENRLTLDELFDYAEAHPTCEMTGRLLDYCHSNRSKKGEKDKSNKIRLNAASIDRIDSNGHYELGNIQMVSAMSNVIKNSFTLEQIDAWCVDRLRHAGYIVIEPEVKG